MTQKLVYRAPNSYSRRTGPFIETLEEVQMSATAAERSLLVAVLERALLDLSDPLWRNNAVNWINCRQVHKDDTHFSFEYLCSVLGLEAEALRSRLSEITGAVKKLRA